MKLQELLQSAREKSPEKQTAPESAQMPHIPEFYTNSINTNASLFELELQNYLVDSNQNVKGR